MRHETQRYSSVKATLEVVTAGVGQTGLAPTVAIQDIATGEWLQNGGGSWDVDYEVNVLAEVDATNLPGLYQYSVPTNRLWETLSLGGHSGFLLKIEESTTSLLEYVKLDIAWNPVIDEINGRKVQAVLLAIFRFLIATDDDSITYYTAGAGTGSGKFYSSMPGVAASARYVDRIAVLRDLNVGNGEMTDVVRIGGIFTDGGGDYLLLQNPDGTTYNGVLCNVDAELYIGMDFLTSRVGAIEDDVIAYPGALADSAVNEIVDKVWDEDIVNFHGGADSSGLYLRNTAAVASKEDIADQVWRETLSDHSGVDFSTAKHLAALTPGSIADQVWDETLSPDHTPGSGTAGDALAAAGGSLTAEDIADAVWDESLSGHHAAQSAGRALAITKGLVQGHHRMKDPTYDPNGRLLTAKLVVYPTAAAAENDLTPDFTFNVTCTYDGDGNLASLLSTE